MDAVMERRIQQRLGLRLDKRCGKSFVPDGAKCTKPVSIKPSQEKKPTSEKRKPTAGTLAQRAALGVVGVLGISAATYLAVKTKYRAGFEQSAREAEDLAKTINPGTVKAKQHSIVFGVGGMAYGEKDDPTRTGERIITAFKMGFSSAKGKDLKMVPIDNNDTNVTASQSQGKGAIDVAKIHWNNITNGRNKTAVNLAAQVIAYGDKYPDRQLVMAGHSYGGMVIHEAQEILRRARPDYEKRLRSLAFGTQHYGLTEAFGESHTIGSPADPFTSKMPTQNLKSFAKVKGHTQGEYFKDAEVQEFVKSMLYRDIKKDSHFDAPPNCTTGERCGDTCIDPRDECNLKDLSPEVDKALADLSDAVIEAIPGYSQIMAGRKFLKSGKAALAVVKNRNVPLQKKIFTSAVILAGITYLGYQKYRDYRRNAVADSATIARTTAKGVATLDTTKNQITFTLDGSGKDKLKTAMAGEFDDHEIIDFSESLEEPTRLPDDMSERDKKLAREVENAKNFFGNLTSGRSNHAVDLAAQILAYREKYPHKSINIVAHGAAAQTAMEAADIAKKARYDITDKLKVVGLQAPDYGIYDSVASTTTIASDRNPTSLFPMKNKTSFGVDDPGDGTGFLKNRRSLAYLKGYLSTKGGTQQEVKSYYDPSYRRNPAPGSTAVPQAKPQPANVPQSTMRPAQRIVTAQGQEITRSADRQFAMEEIQRYEKTKSQLENNVRSSEGVIKNLKDKRERLYFEMEQAIGAETIQELEEAARNITASINKQSIVLTDHQKKLQGYLKNYTGPRIKQDSEQQAIKSLRLAVTGTSGERGSPGVSTLGGNATSAVLTARKVLCCTLAS